MDNKNNNTAPKPSPSPFLKIFFIFCSIAVIITIFLFTVSLLEEREAQALNTDQAYSLLKRNIQQDTILISKIIADSLLTKPELKGFLDYFKARVKIKYSEAAPPLVLKLEQGDYQYITVITGMPSSEEWDALADGAYIFYLGGRIESERDYVLATSLIIEDIKSGWIHRSRIKNYEATK